MNNKLFFLDQHGCAKNQVDGELIIGHLAKDGWMRTDEPQNASLIIVNSCGFIESAKKESIDAIYNINASYPEAKIILKRNNDSSNTNTPIITGIIYFFTKSPPSFS